MITKQTRLLRVLDFFPLTVLLLLAAVLTLGCGWGYYRLQAHACNRDGLACAKGPCERLFWDDVYFSVVTEATLGYGDMAPLGEARYLASFQVFAGLTLVGLFVTKLASLERGHLNSIARQLKGHWIEYIESEKLKMLSFSVFTRVGDKIAYEGENFNEKGEQIGFFSGTLTTGDKAKFRFRYLNRERTDDRPYPTEGTCHITFSTKRWSWATFSWKWVTFTGVIRDFVDNARYEQWGWDATKSQCDVINRKDEKNRDLSDDEHRKLVSGIFSMKQAEANKTRPLNSGLPKESCDNP